MCKNGQETWLFEKDIKTSNRINYKALFEIIEKFVVNNFGAVISIKSIYNYLKNTVKINVKKIFRYFRKKLKLYILERYLI